MTDDSGHQPGLPANRTIARYGWVRDLPDARDHIYSAPHAALTRPPAKVDLTPGMPAVYDQGALGSCTANALAGAFEFDLGKQRLADFVPSRLFIYYNERVIESTVGSDSGAQLRDGVKSLAKQGVCTESEWPYDIPKFADKPAATLYQKALANRIVSYQRVTQTVAQLRGCLAAGYPFVVGFTVYQSFESQQVAETGVVPMPVAGEEILGGHAVAVVGYDEASQRFRARNSWGAGWGQAGYFTIPYAYLADSGLAADCWTLRTVS